MQSVSSRIWTRVAVSISYDDNHYTTGTYRYRWLIVGIVGKFQGLYTDSFSSSSYPIHLSSFCLSKL